MPQFVTSPFDRLSEADIQHACGARVFAQADQLERTGHVVTAGAAEDGQLVGQVRGTWRRVEEVKVSAQGTRLAPSCTCATRGFCRHVGALLLHWVRQPRAFTSRASSDELSARFATTSTEALQRLGGLVNTQTLSLTEEMAGLLEHHTLARLRTIAQARGISYPKSRTKADMVALLATALSSPASIDAALGQLDADSLLALDVVQLCGPEATTNAYRDFDTFDEDEDDFGLPEDLVAEIYGSLGRAGSQPPLDTLIDRGLLFVESPPGLNADLLRIPRAVRARLRSLDFLLDNVTKVEVAPDTTSTQPAVDELFLVVASALAVGDVRAPASGRRPEGSMGWDAVPTRTQTRVNPWHPRLETKDSTLLAERTGLAPVAVELLVEMMIALGIVEVTSHLTPRPDRLQRYFERSIPERWLAIGTAWQSLDEWSETLLIADAAGPFALTVRGPFPQYDVPLTAEAFAFRGILTRLLARLGPNRWHGLDDLMAWLGQLIDDVDAKPFVLETPHVLSTIFGTDRTPNWWLAERDAPDVALDLTDPEVLERYYRVLTRALLTGPLKWLGVVEIAERGGDDLDFGVRPGANALIAGIALADDSVRSAPVSELLVSEDLSILVPSRTTDPEVYRFVGEIGELTGITREGLGYRLTAERVQQLFDSGMTGPQLVEYLASRARRFPRAARSRLEGWWASYDTVQLYDDLTLIELGDDYLLPELLATSSLEKVLIHTFSPRLILVETSAADTLRVELERLGHTPKLVEGE